MRIVIEGRDLPGRAFETYADVHVALQVRAAPVGPVPGDAASARWETEVSFADGRRRAQPRTPRSALIAWARQASGARSL